MTLPYSPRVLVVEAREQDRAWLIDLLRRAGFECVAVATCVEAVRVAGEEFFDALLCDGSLPDGDGAGLLRRMGVHRPARAVLMVHAAGRRFARIARRGGYDAWVDFDHAQPGALAAVLEPVASARGVGM